MEKIKRNFGFGCMRLPMQDGDVDLEQTKRMVDLFLERGFNYFDTAHGYLDGKSERAIRECLTSRYPRERYILTNKLSGNFFEKEEDIRPLFERQLAACGVEYFDFYLMHAQGARNYPHYRECRAYETAFALKREGKVRHVGISFHDSPEMLEQILTDYPEIEAVQIQFNYLDFDDPAIQSRAVYEMARKHGKSVIIMEPVKGGRLVDLPEEAKAVFSALGGGSPASYAIRFAAGFEGVMMVLSGMSDLLQMQDNSAFMADFKPLDETERAAVDEVRRIFKTKNFIPCTACRYCVPGCPQGVPIPEIFATVNAQKLHQNWNSRFYYSVVCGKAGAQASDCVGCGRCESVCPQHLQIRELLREAAREFEN
ncbi:MAG: aldo/keto reductase [Oscillospiraceae bacterium]|nr:aldo/keto reductase [Oscillospiraceae bacterium]